MRLRLPWWDRPASPLQALVIVAMIALVSLFATDTVILWVAPEFSKGERAVGGAGVFAVLAGTFIWWTLVRPLQLTNRHLRAFFDNATVGLIRTTPDGRITMVNRRLVHMLGYDSEEDLLGANLATDIYQSPEERERVVRTLITRDTFDDIETNWRRKDGQLIGVSLHGRTFRDRKGRPVRFEGAVEDLTEARRLGHHLRLLESALNAAANAILITNRDGAIEWVNPAFSTLTGYSIDEVKGETPRVLKSGQTGTDVYQALWAAIRAGQVWHGELVNQRKDGTLYNQELTITPIRDDDNQVRHFIGVSQDVTERHRLEAQLRQAQKMEAIGQLTGGIAHDFNNILAVILANTELVASAAPLTDPGAREDLDDIRDAAARGAAMVRKLLGFSRLAELQKLPVDLGELVSGTSALLRRLLPESVEVRTEVTEKVPVVRADVGAVEQILVNLATNARDAMPDGGVLQISVSSQTIAPSDQEAHPWISVGHYACIAVSDSGQGMDAATQARIFEPFFTTKPPGKGTGLGMPMIYGLTKQHGGAVHVYSEVGRGTTIKIYLPAAPEPAIVLNATPAPPARAGHGELILLAEDEESLRRSGRRILERLGYRVLAAADGAEALELFQKHRGEIALVISDLVMPRLGGKELYEAIRQSGNAPRFILATGYAPAELRASGKFFEPVTHLPKPWTLADMAEAVQAALAAPGARSA